MAVPGPYIGTLSSQQAARMGTGKLKKYYTYKAGGAGRKANNVLKLAKDQIAMFEQGRGYYAAPRPKGSGAAAPPPPTTPPRGGGATGTDMSNFTLDQFIALLSGKQNDALAAQLEDSRRRSWADQSALGGFGSVIQNFATEQWNAANQGWQNAGAAQTAGAEALGQQVGAQVGQARALQEVLGQQLGYGGQTDMPTSEAAAKQIASEGGAQTGAMMGQVGTAWGGYGATRPDYLGFMTGHQQMQNERAHIEADRDLRTKFLEMGMDNPQKALEMWTAIQENKRQNVSTSLAQQTLRQNIIMQKAELKQKYDSMRLSAKTAAQKRELDRWYKEQQVMLRNQEIGISQQNADASTKRAEASMINATKPPSPGKGPKYSAGTYQQKIAASLKDLPTLFNASGSGKKGKNRVTYAFNVLWAQMSPYVSVANQPKAKALLRQRIQNAARGYTPDKGGSGDPLDQFRP